MRHGIAQILVALSICSGASSAQAASLSWVFDVPYLCDPECVGAGLAKATVSEGTDGQAGVLLFLIELNPLGSSLTFMNKDVASFTFELQPGITGVTISGIVGDGPHTWTPLLDVTNLAGPPGPWTGGLTYDADPFAPDKQFGANGATVSFSLSADTALNLASLARILDPIGLLIFFTAEIEAAGGIAHISACAPWGTGGCAPPPPDATPAPPAVLLFASGIGALGLLTLRRRKMF